MPVVEFLRFVDLRGPQRPSQDFTAPETNFSGKFFKLVDKTQFEALLQTQAAEVGCTARE